MKAQVIQPDGPGGPKYYHEDHVQMLRDKVAELKEECLCDEEEIVSLQKLLDAAKRWRSDQENAECALREAVDLIDAL